jgi:hypothetical protein
MPDNRKTDVKPGTRLYILQLAVIFGLVIIEQQLETIGVYSSTPVGTVGEMPLLYLCTGALISVASFLSYMRVQFGAWCIIPPGMSRILHDHNGSPAMKIMVIAVILQCLSLIPLFFLVYHVMTSLNLGPSVVFYRIEYLLLFLSWAVLASIGMITFGHFYEKSKKGRDT